MMKRALIYAMICCLFDIQEYKSNPDFLHKNTTVTFLLQNKGFEYEKC